jgi:hypothetical protein
MNGSATSANTYVEEIKNKISLSNDMNMLWDYGCNDSEKWKIFKDHIIYMQYYDADHDGIKNEVWTKVNKRNPRIKQSIIVPGYATRQAKLYSSYSFKNDKTIIIFTSTDEVVVRQYILEFEDVKKG